MIIFMLAVAMTIAMLIATAFGIHQEAQRVRLRSCDIRFDPFMRTLRDAIPGWVSCLCPCCSAGERLYVGPNSFPSGMSLKGYRLWRSWPVSAHFH